MNAAPLLYHMILWQIGKADDTQDDTKPLECSYIKGLRHIKQMFDSRRLHQMENPVLSTVCDKPLVLLGFSYSVSAENFPLLYNFSP